MTVRTDFPRPVREIEHTWLHLSHGTRLAARIWLPEDAEADPVPVPEPGPEPVPEPGPEVDPGPKRFHVHGSTGCSAAARMLPLISSIALRRAPSTPDSSAETPSTSSATARILGCGP